jgi:hypothetical protein
VCLIKRPRTSDINEDQPAQVQNKLGAMSVTDVIFSMPWGFTTGYRWPTCEYVGTPGSRC